MKENLKKIIYVIFLISLFVTGIPTVAIILQWVDPSIRLPVPKIYNIDFLLYFSGAIMGMFANE